MYSTVKSPVNPNSIMRSSHPREARTLATLSMRTASTLSTMAQSNATSKLLPAGVSASKMTVCNRSRQDVSDELTAPKVRRAYLAKVGATTRSLEPRVWT